MDSGIFTAASHMLVAFIAARRSLRSCWTHRELSARRGQPTQSLMLDPRKSTGEHGSSAPPRMWGCYPIQANRQGER